ncbi:MAG: agmatine deiminase family protein [Gemmatimonadetes bacterium]|nr:agmatine deiminase family protein [Gemmatimonadota bacterium]
MPAEWDHHAATWLGWPHNAADWPGKIAAIHWVYGEIIRKLAPEPVRILVNSAAHEKQARGVLERVGTDPKQAEFYRIPTDRGWTRDSGPIFVRSGGETPQVAIAGFRFNAWAKYRNWKKDAQVPARAARSLGLKVLPAAFDGRDVVLEGGSIDVNGRGALLTTEECLLDPKVQVRNPGFTREDYERVFADVLGATKTTWLGRGIAGDDTHGHVDDVCRFVTSNTVVLCQEENSRDENYGPLQENRERLEGARLEDGSRFEVLTLPMPAPLHFEGRRLPASYANFYIGNDAVLVPTFNDPNDREVLGVLKEVFSGRMVVGIHAVDLVWGLGTLHCLTQQEPARKRNSGDERRRSWPPAARPSGVFRGHYVDR